MKKIICVLFLILIFNINFTYANTILNQKENEVKISSGTTLKNYELFTNDGWINVNVIAVNLKDKYTEIGIMTPSTGTGTLDTVLSMANENYAIAAINGDFFAGKSGKGNSVGLSINNDKVLSSTAIENKDKNMFSTFILDENNNVFIEYLNNKITITSKRTHESIDISAINKFSDNYNSLFLYTRDWGEFSLGSNSDLKLTEMVVENGKVIDILYDEPATEIPENGFVISTTGPGAEFIKDNFKKGYKVDLDVKYSPNLEKINLAISGGAKLIEDGDIPEKFEHNITGKNPRSALGISEDKKTLYLIAVDGRQKNSIGMTQEELAEFLKSLDIYNAINLDGGSSTTLVAQSNETGNPKIINKPSGGFERKVANSLGIFSTAPNSEKLYGLELSVEDKNIFKGEEREIKVTGYNKYHNPVEINYNDIDWDYNGVKVSVKDNKVSGNTVGEVTLTASIGRIKESINLNILSDVNELYIYPKTKNILPSQSIEYEIKAKNKNGYYAKTDNSTIKSNIIEFYINSEKQKNIPSDAKIGNHIFTATTPGEYLISFTKNNVTSYALVSVASQQEYILDDFETESFKFDEYPDEVIGNAILSTNQVHSGKYSIKLDYDFRKDIKVRGAYVELKEPITIPENAKQLSFWLYNDSYKDAKIKIKLKDAKNATKIFILQDNIPHEGWKQIKYDLNNVALPAKLSDIYLAEDDLSVQEKGTVYIDQLSYYGTKILNDSNIRLPKDIKLKDETNLNFENDETITISLLDTLVEPTLMIDDLKNKKLINDINKTSNITVFTEDTNNLLTQNLKTQNIIANKYDLIETKQATIITLDTSNNSLRKTDSTQWTNFQYDIKDSEKENIILVLNSSLDNFTDLKERQLFINTLCELKRETKKNIIVLHTGFSTDYSMERGVKFLGINTKNISPENIAKDFSYIQISITGDNICYQIKQIF